MVYGAERHAGVQLFGHHQVLVGTGGDLRQVRHRHDLAVLPQLAHQATHGFSHCAAYA